jgi:integrase/recombinase XerD
VTPTTETATRVASPSPRIRDDDGALNLALSNADPGAVSVWLLDQVRAVAARGGRSESTRRAYTAAALRILPYLNAQGWEAATMTSEQAAQSLLALGTGAPPYTEACAASSVRLTATAVRVALVSRNLNPAAWCSPMVRAVLAELDARNAPKAITPIRLDDLRRMLSVVAPTGHGIRIRTAFLVGYAGALRVSELASLTWGRIGWEGQDRVVQVRRKRHREWCRVSILGASDPGLCPVRALAELQRAEALTVQLTTETPIFGAVRTIQGWVAAMATRAGVRGAVSPHSLRHGWASDAATAGIPLPAIQAHLGHADPATTSRYAAHADLRRFY